MHSMMHPYTRSRIADQAQRDRTTIEQLRTRSKKSANEVKPTVADVTTIVTDLLNVVPLEETAAKMPRPNRDQQVKMVLDTIGTFGTWLTHSVGASGADMAFVKDEPQLTLFQTVTTAVQQLKPSRRKPSNPVRIPMGYEPSADHKRDVTRALAAIVMAAPGADVIARFVARTYRTRSGGLTYPLVAGVWMFAIRARLDKVDQVSNDTVFHSQVVAAYDLLDVARLDAIEALERLAGGSLKPAAARKAIAKSRWLAESELNRIEQLLDTDFDAYTRAVEQLGRRLKVEPGRYRPASIAALSAGQVQRICAASGLKVENDRISEEAEIRSKLRQMGLSVDSDRLVPEALRALERGSLDAFWEIMQARLDGDTTWGEQLQELASER
jgi:hypothetical protein